MTQPARLVTVEALRRPGAADLSSFTKEQLDLLAEQRGPLRRIAQQELLKRGNTPDAPVTPEFTVPLLGGLPAPVSPLATAVLNALPTEQVQVVQQAVDAQALVQRADAAEAAAKTAQGAAEQARAAADAAVAALPQPTPEATVQAAVSAVIGQDSTEPNTAT